MERNPLARVENGAVRRARVRGASGPELSPGQAEAGRSRQAGSNDSVSGAWRGYGLVGRTLLGDPFLVSGE
jgi:hypothetical protein